MAVVRKRVWIVPGYRRRRCLLMSSAAYAIFMLPWLRSPMDIVWVTK
jgi:hypothetical protein